MAKQASAHHSQSANLPKNLFGVQGRTDPDNIKINPDFRRLVAQATRSGDGILPDEVQNPRVPGTLWTRSNEQGAITSQTPALGHSGGYNREHDHGMVVLIGTSEGAPAPFGDVLRVFRSKNANQLHAMIAASVGSTIVIGERRKTEATYLIYEIQDIAELPRADILAYWGGGRSEADLEKVRTEDTPVFTLSLRGTARRNWKGLNTERVPEMFSTVVIAADRMLQSSTPQRSPTWIEAYSSLQVRHDNRALYFKGDVFAGNLHRDNAIFVDNPSQFLTQVQDEIADYRAALADDPDASIYSKIPMPLLKELQIVGDDTVLLRFALITPNHKVDLGDTKNNSNSVETMPGPTLADLARSDITVFETLIREELPGDVVGLAPVVFFGRTSVADLIDYIKKNNYTDPTTNILGTPLVTLK
jgi:hypothetical protein